MRSRVDSSMMPAWCQPRDCASSQSSRDFLMRTGGSPAVIMMELRSAFEQVHEIDNREYDETATDGGGEPQVGGEPLPEETDPERHDAVSAFPEIVLADDRQALANLALATGHHHSSASSVTFVRQPGAGAERPERSPVRPDNVRNAGAAVAGKTLEHAHSRLSRTGIDDLQLRRDPERMVRAGAENQRRARTD